MSQYAALSTIVYEETDEPDAAVNDWVNNWQQLDFNFDDYRPPLKKGNGLKASK